MCLLLSERSLCLGLILQEVWSHRRLPDGSVFSSQLVEGREELLSLLVIPALEFRDPAACVPFHQLMRPLGAVWLLQTIKHFKDKAKVGWGGSAASGEAGEHQEESCHQDNRRNENAFCRCPGNVPTSVLSRFQAVNKWIPDRSASERHGKK